VIDLVYKPVEGEEFWAHAVSLRIQLRAHEASLVGQSSYLWYVGTLSQRPSDFITDEDWLRGAVVHQISTSSGEKVRETRCLGGPAQSSK